MTPLPHSGAMEKKDVRLQLVIGSAELDALDEWRAANHVWSRSEAIREAIRRMVAEPAKTPSPAKPKPK